MDHRDGGHGFSITKNFAWIAKAFGRSLTPSSSSELPDLVAPTVRPTFDALGWSRWGEAQALEVSAPNVSVLDLPVFQREGFFRVIIWAGGAHDDVLLTHRLQFSLVCNVEGISPIPISSLAQFFVLVGSPSLAAPTGLALDRPVIIRAGNTLRVNALPAMAGGDILQLQAYFVDIPEGEYIPGII